MDVRCDVHLLASRDLFDVKVTHKPNQKVVDGLPDLTYYIT